SLNQIDLTPATGKRGAFEIVVGTTSVFGSFGTDAVVTLTTSSGAAVSTTDNNVGTINVFDNGSVVAVENGFAQTNTAYIKYWYVN
ncbi:MAG: hypothetical protein WC479_11425, partial [Candidatus Izemoplasmatales bacterium]